MMMVAIYFITIFCYVYQGLKRAGLYCNYKKWFPYHKLKIFSWKVLNWFNPACTLFQNRNLKIRNITLNVQLLMRNTCPNAIIKKINHYDFDENKFIYLLIVSFLWDKFNKNAIFHHYILTLPRNYQFYKNDLA